MNMSRSIPIILALVACLAAQAWAQRPAFPPHSGFPYCRCHDYDAASSPIKLAPVGSVVSSVDGDVPSTELETEITVAEEPGVAAERSACWNQIWNEGIEKIEFKTTAGVCNKFNVAVYLNDRQLSGAVDPKGFVRVHLGSKTPIELVGTRIKIVGSGDCNTQELLQGGPAFQYSVFNWDSSGLNCCPTVTFENSSPPPPLEGREQSPPIAADAPPTPDYPPVDLNFPYCKCDIMTNERYVPFAFYVEGVIDFDESDTSFVFGFIRVDPRAQDPDNCDPANPCCSMDLNKIEFHIRDTCKRVVRDITLYKPSNPSCTSLFSCAYDQFGPKKNPTYQSYGAAKQVFKITNLNLDTTNGDFVLVRIAVKKTQQCPSFYDVLAADPFNAYTAVFDRTKKCCPQWLVFPDIPASTGVSGGGLPRGEGTARLPQGNGIPTEIFSIKATGPATEEAVQQALANFGARQP